MNLMAKITRQRESHWWLFTLLLLLWPTLCQSAETQNPPEQMSLQVAEPKGNNILTLDTAIQMALDNNPAIVASKERIGTADSGLLSNDFCEQFLPDGHRSEYHLVDFNQGGI
jgi:hypothetical protein